MPDRNRGLLLDFSAVEHPGTLESMIPIWGSGKEAIADFNDGDYGGAAANMALAASDVFLAKALVQAAGKGAFKAAPAIWRNARRELGRDGHLAPGQHGHHWLIPQNGVGKSVPGAIKNGKWNVMPMPSAEVHGRLHGSFKGKPQYNAVQRIHYGVPTGAKAGVANTAGHGVTGSKAQADRKR